MKRDSQNKTEGNVRKSVHKVLAFLNMEVDALVRKNKHGLAENYRSSGRSLQSYLITLHKKDISLHKVTEEFLMGYQQWLINRGVKRNTQAFYMRNLHAVYTGDSPLASARLPMCRPVSHIPRSVLSHPN